jgi:hypothetical protein
MSDGRSIARVKVPVGEVVIEAYRAVFGQLGLFFDLAWLPLLIQLALSVVPGLLLHFLPGMLPGLSDDALVYIELAGVAVCVTAFGVRWYAAMLFADRRTLSRAAFLKAWPRFIAYILVLFVAPSVAALQISPDKLVAAGGPTLDASVQTTVVSLILTASVALGLLVFLACARSSLLFPAAAYGKPLNWAEAWRRMRGNTWRYVGCWALTSVPFLLAVGFLENMALGLTGFTDASAMKVPGGILLDGLADTIVFFVSFALGAAILSGFYRRLVLHRPI